MATSPIPDGLTDVTPSMVVSPCAEAIDWYVRAFGATEIEPRMTGPDGMVGHAEVRFGSAVVMISRRGVISTPYVSGFLTSSGFFLAFMMLGRVG